LNNSLIDFAAACEKNAVAPTQFLLTVNIAGQTMSLFENPVAPALPPDHSFQFLKLFSCSTSQYGVGQVVNSRCTPLGLHRIAEKIGTNEPSGTVFKGRKIIGHTTQPGFADAKITTRILWLDGLEPGFNRDGNVDSHDRYIYIHGTADQASFGRPATHGCIHLSDADLIPLFDLLPAGTLVWIGER
jgi:L,D-transpeptidase YbiS